MTSGRDKFWDLREQLALDCSHEATTDFLDALSQFLSADTLSSFVDSYRRNYEIEADETRECRYCGQLFTVPESNADTECSDTCTMAHDNELDDWAEEAAKAICAVNPSAGMTSDGPNDIPTRVTRLLTGTQYGVYIAPGNPNGWGDSKTVATIYMEPKGDGVAPPLEYYGNGMDVSFYASQKLGDAYIEFVNAAVAVVQCD